MLGAAEGRLQPQHLLVDHGVDVDHDGRWNPERDDSGEHGEVLVHDLEGLIDEYYNDVADSFSVMQMTLILSLRDKRPQILNQTNLNSCIYF